MDLEVLSKLTERVRVAKQLFKTTFISAQSSKQESWIKELARDSGLEPDEFMAREMGSEEEQERKRKQDAERARAQKLKLKSLLDLPVEKSTAQRSRRKSAFIVVAK